jgi:small multidrug resistance pump
MSWLFLLLAILSEVLGTIAMKLSDGFTQTLPSFMVFIFYTVSVILLIFAVKEIDLSVAYAIWSALGTALIVTAGILWFQESIGLLKIASLGLIIIGMIGLNLSEVTR